MYLTFRIPLCFFFSSRRRHTRSLCDWSSDVCSSDLDREALGGGGRAGARAAVALGRGARRRELHDRRDDAAGHRYQVLNPLLSLGRPSGSSSATTTQCPGRPPTVGPMLYLGTLEGRVHPLLTTELQSRIVSMPP